MTFVLAGQGMSIVQARATGTERDPDRWTPTPMERRNVSAPIGRIARRHMTADKQAADTVDAALIAAGLGAFVVRAGFGANPDLEEDTTDGQA